MPVIFNPFDANLVYIPPQDAGAGTVTSVSVATANGIAGTVDNPTTTPAITLELATTSVGTVLYDNGSNGIAHDTTTTDGLGNISAKSLSLTGASLASLAITATSTSAYPAAITGPNVSGSSYGLEIVAGTNASDKALLIQNRGQSASLLTVKGDGTVSTKLNTLDDGGGSMIVSDTLSVPVIAMPGSGSGTIQILPQAASGTYNLNLPTTAGTTGQVLTSQGGDASAMTWTTPSTGTVTAVSVASANGFTGSSSGGVTPALTLATSINAPVLAGNGTAISAATLGNLTDAGTDGITITGGSSAVIGSGTSISQHVADTSHNGYLSSTDWNTFNGKGAGSVTSVGLSVPATSLFGVTGSPVTTTGTLGLTTTGTSGGVPYFSSTSQLASSGALTASQLVLGGGAGSAPTSLSAGSQYQVLTMGASNPGYGAVNLAQSAAVTGTLGVANGGTGATIDVAPGSFSAANNQGSAANVTGLSFSTSTIRAFTAYVSVSIVAGSSLFEYFELRGIYNGSTWSLAQTSNGDASGVAFTITSAGQIQYTSANSASFTSNTMKFRAVCLGQ